MSTSLYKALSQAVVLTSSANRDLNEEIKYAALNTAVGLVVVFAVLTIFIVIISLFKIIPYLQNKYSSNNTNASNIEAIDEVVNQITEQEESEELVNDYELVAVITAAIYASMGTEVPTDGLVVRSIRKVGKIGWTNAKF